MNQVSRICPQCGGTVALHARYCGECGYDTSSGLPVSRTNLPATVGKAALPVVAGLAGLALRSGWKLLQAHLTQLATHQEPAPARPPAPQPQQTANPPVPRAGRTIRIRSSWIVGDGRGNWRRGSEEHVIEIDK